MNKTKKKIILSAIELFNENGLANVKNQEIASTSDISLSNFNYHFSTKKDLVHAVFEYMKEILKEEVYSSNDLLTKDHEGLDIAKRYFEFEQKFRFFYLDTHNILQTYPQLEVQMREQVEAAIQIIKNINYLSIGKGYMKPPPADMPKLYDHLAEQLLVNNHFLFAQLKMRGLEEDVVKRGLEANFAICYPYLTAIGKARFQKFLEENT